MAVTQNTCVYRQYITCSARPLFAVCVLIYVCKRPTFSARLRKSIQRNRVLYVYSTRYTTWARGVLRSAPKWPQPAVPFSHAHTHPYTHTLTYTHVEMHSCSKFKRSIMRLLYGIYCFNCISVCHARTPCVTKAQWRWERKKGRMRVHV